MKYYYIIFIYLLSYNLIYSQTTYSKYFNILPANPKYGNETLGRCIKYKDKYYCRGGGIQDKGQTAIVQSFMCAFDNSFNLLWKKNIVGINIADL